MDPSRLHQQDRAHLWHPYTRHSALEGDGLPVIVRGEGLELYDASGRGYIDAISSWWCCNLGHSHPRVVDAIVAQSRELQHSILGNLTHPPAVELATALAQLMPDPKRHVHFASDGASAVEAAMKIAVQYWYNRGMDGRHRFASLQHAYHGDTLATVSLGYLDTFHQAFARVRTPCAQLPVPPYDASLEEAKRDATAIIEREAAHLAAVVVEPLCQGAAGMRIYPAEYLRHIEELCRRHDVLLIVDEIATGYGRTGRMFAFEHAGIDPDIVCVGKGLSAGYLPISAAIVRDALYEEFSDQPEDHTFYHGHTFAGNPVAAAAALATLRVYEEEGVVEQAGRLGEVMAEGLGRFESLATVKDVRSLGMIGAVELSSDEEPSHGPPRAARVQALMRKEGILVRPLGSVIYLMLPLVTPEETLVGVVQKLQMAVNAAE